MPGGLALRMRRRRVDRVKTGPVDASKGSMDQPLWQILFNIALIGFVARRAAFGLAMQAHRAHPALWGVYVALCAVCAFAGVAILFSRRWVITGLVSLVGAFAVTTFVEMGVGGVAPAGYLLAQLAVALAGGAALVALAIKTPPEPSHR
jgi:hypothetical protein